MFTTMCGDNVTGRPGSEEIRSAGGIISFTIEKAREYTRTRMPDLSVNVGPV